MEFTLNKRQEQVLKSAQRFSQELVIPNADRWDKSNKFPTETWQKMAKAKLTGLPIPRKYGGAGQDVLSYVQAVEEISRGSAALGVTLAVHVSLVSQPLLWFGTEEQKLRYLKPLAKGEKFGSFCLTEPGAGSDVASMESKATKVDSHYVINGRKYFIVNAPMASTFLVFAMTDKSLAS
jgi:butyryl-CoA dehydrogenase